MRAAPTRRALPGVLWDKDGRWRRADGDPARCDGILARSSLSSCWADRTAGLPGEGGMGHTGDSLMWDSWGESGTRALLPKVLEALGWEVRPGKGMSCVHHCCVRAPGLLRRPQRSPQPRGHRPSHQTSCISPPAPTGWRSHRFSSWLVIRLGGCLCPLPVSSCPLSHPRRSSHACPPEGTNEPRTGTECTRRSTERSAPVRLSHRHPTSSCPASRDKPHESAPNVPERPQFAPLVIGVLQTQIAARHYERAQGSGSSPNTVRGCNLMSADSDAEQNGRVGRDAPGALPASPMCSLAASGVGTTTRWEPGGERQRRNLTGDAALCQRKISPIR